MIFGIEIGFLLAFLGIGILAGLIGGLLGLSGGVVTVPALILTFHLMGLPQGTLIHTAIATSLAAMILTGVASTWTHHRHKAVMWNLVFLMVPGVFLGCLLGPFLVHFFSEVFLQILFGIFLCGLGIYTFFHRKKRKERLNHHPYKTLYSWIGMGIGTVASMLGIGGGIFTVPLFLSQHFSEKKAVATSAAIGLLITLMASLAYLYFGIEEVKTKKSLGYIYLPAFALIGLGTVLFAPLGAKLAHWMDGAKLRKIFAIVLAIVGILMVWS